MSTRCHIIVKEDNRETFIYHHCDGYPSGVGAELEELLAECERDNNFNNLVDKIVDIDGGYIVDEGIHGDEDFIYTITLNNNSCILKCDKVYPNEGTVYEKEYKGVKYDKDMVMKIFKVFDEHGLIKDDLCFDPEHFIETVIIKQLNS